MAPRSNLCTICASCIVRAESVDLSSKHALLGDFYQPASFEKVSVRVLQRPASRHVHFTDSRTVVMDPVANNKAWKSLQEKIQQLEGERKQAEQHMKHLCDECVQSIKFSEQENNKKDISINNEDANGPSVQLSTTADNCSLLQLQLQCINAWENGEPEKNIMFEKQSMETPSKRSYVGSFCPLPSLENISLTSIDVQQRPAPHHATIIGSRNLDEADAMSPATNNRELADQLATVEDRCSLLEKQLEYMRTMVEHTETEKNNLMEKQASLQMDRHWDCAELQSKLEKLEILEQECLKVNATQTRAESKIHELEQKLQEEQHQRKLIQDKAAQLQTRLEINRILIGSCSSKKKKKTKKKKDIVKNEMRGENSRPPRVWPGLVEFPFVAGTSSSSSHSVTANIQNVLHLMKHYNTMTFDARQKLPVQRTVKNSRDATYGNVKNGDPQFVSTCSSTSSPTEGLSELLLALQDELGQMSFEHQDLLKQIQGTINTDVREDLERELDCLVKRMEKKGDQISKLKKHQANVVKLKLKAKKMRRQMADTKKRAKALDEMKKVPVAPKGTEFSLKTTSVLGQKGKESLQLLRNAQKLQLTLRQNDITWDQ
uniref:centrosomal protein CEP57L1 isoform X2 n=1 Tax=Pristiophorus japonicus TaxID=55135 RepID=UPI00398E95C1